ncbi:hypothetical protein [Streptomyces chartreusis]|uniref:hypothetical protein n=1 Tax=Streptomyces chartreusis TaxID=1969 RepID=UPI002E8008EF|nr:hypothetical protein [Streptomyces chartreusis]WUB15335.1 hypothetical protein OG997_00910 [Streptomyces chartreusis]
MTTDADLAALLPQLSMRDALAELQAARCAAEARPPKRTIIPEPELPPMWPHPDVGVMRFPCTLGCGWKREVTHFTLDDEPISVPLSAGTEEISRIFNERAERRAATFRAGVEQAIRGHFTEAHAGPEPPERETW